MLEFIERLRPGGIAVVDMHGTIGPALRPLDYTRLLMRLREDESVQGVVLNVESPGGSAGGSELITRAVQRLREEKPVVAFIGTVGASGGYMIASAAEHIIALPSSLVGSIGVISYRPLVYDALSRIGVRMDVGKSGRLKDMLSPFREPTDEERAKEQRLLDSMYDLFVSGVARARGLSDDHVRELATGEIYPAGEALEHRLIDDLGDLDDAIDWMAERSGTKRRVRNVHPRRTLRELVMGRTAAASPGALAASVLGELGVPVSGGLYYLYTGGYAGGTTTR